MRRDIKEILSVEDRVDIKGEPIEELKGVSLEGVNATFNEFPDEVKEVSGLKDYSKLWTEVMDEDLSLITEDINKSIYGQDKSENLFVREDVQNARDAIITERLVIRLLENYYVRYKDEKFGGPLASFVFNQIIWNLYHTRQYTQKLQQILKEEEVDSDRAYNFFRKVLDDITHEASHFFDVAKASHESAEELVGLFAWRQKELIRRFIRSRKNWEDIISELRRVSPNF